MKPFRTGTLWHGRCLPARFPFAISSANVSAHCETNLLENWGDAKASFAHSPTCGRF